MRKLSMKKPGTPAIEEDSDRGSGGVSAEGLGARLPSLGFAGDPPLEPLRPPPAPAPAFDSGRLWLLPVGEPPCAFCPLTRGVVATCGALGAAAGGTGSVVLVVGALGTSGAGVVVVVPVGGL